MKKLFLALWLVLMLCGVSGATDFYVSPTGAGLKNGTSQANAYEGFADLDDYDGVPDADGWTDIAAGDTLYLMDGTYTNTTANVVDPPDAWAGTAADIITIKAINDGEVVIDCQSVANSIGVKLSTNNDYITLEGFNIKSCGDPLLSMGTSCNNVIIKRIVGWDADVLDTGDGEVGFSIDGVDALVEDCAFFGRGRKGFMAHGNSITFRRLFSRWEHNDAVGPKIAISYNYNSTGNTIVENCIATWDDDMVTIDQAHSLIGFDQAITLGDIKLLGNIAYVKSDQNVYDYIIGIYMATNDTPGTGTVADNIFYSNNSAIIAGVYVVPDALTTVTVDDNTVIGATYNDCVADGGYITGFEVGNISGDAMDTIVMNCVRGVTNGNEFDYAATDNNTDKVCSGTITNEVTSVSLADLVASGNNIMRPDLVAAIDTEGEAGDTIGAVIKDRYVDGVLQTGVSLWPWPMNQRIIDAMTDAGYTGADIIDVTDTVFTLGGGTNPYSITPPPSNTFYVMEGGTATWNNTTACGAATAMDITTHNDDTDLHDYLDGTKAITIVLCDDADIKTQITVPKSGAAGFPITYTAESASTLIDLDSAAATYGIYAENKDYITIDGVTVQEAAYYGIRFYNDCDNITIHGCTVTANGWGGIGFGGTGFSNVTISDCTVTDNDVAGGGNYAGIVLLDSTTVSTGNLITGNTVSGNTLSGIYFGRASGTISQNNVTANQEVAGYAGIDVRGASGSEVAVNIAHNYIHDVIDADNTYPGIYVTYPSGTAIYGNIIDTIADAGADDADGIVINYAVAGTNVIYNNTIYNIEGDGIVVTNSAAGGTLSIKNNIIEEFNNAGYGLNVDAASDDVALTITDYNCIYDAGGGDYAYWAAGAQATLANYKAAAVGNCTHSYQEDPNLNGEAAGDFTITDATGNCDGTGVALGNPYNVGFLAPDITWPFTTASQSFYGNSEIGAYIFVETGQPSPTKETRRIIGGNVF